MEIRIENFKGFKDTVVSLGSFNAIVGANGTGKTSILELFKFMSLCISPNKTPAYPFAQWWGFENIVWSHDERLPISIHVNYKVESYDVKYSAVISGIGGNLQFKEEHLNISNYLDIERKTNTVAYTFAKKFKDKHKKLLTESKSRYESKLATFLDGHTTVTLSHSTSILNTMYGIRDNLNELELLTLFFPDNNDKPELYVPSPFAEVLDEWIPLYLNAISLFEPKLTDSFNDGLVIMRDLNYDALHQPSQIGNSSLLQENGEGLINILFQWKLKDKWPARIKRALKELFPDWSINFNMTDDGRILMRVNDGTDLLNPPSIPDGFYKLLAILVAIEIKPRFLLIDELETSLHARIIEYILAELYTCDATVIITTHSPTVMDLVELGDLVLLERTGNQTTCRKIENPDKLNHMLVNEGLTISEKWVYGQV